jgi:hypothetical protein
LVESFPPSLIGFPLSKNADVENADACLCVCAYGLSVSILSTGGDGGRPCIVCLYLCSVCKLNSSV